MAPPHPLLARPTWAAALLVAALACGGGGAAAARSPSPAPPAFSPFHGAYRADALPAPLQRCLAEVAGDPAHARLAADYARLPLLAIVVTATPDGVDTATAHNLQVGGWGVG